MLGREYIVAVARRNGKQDIRELSFHVIRNGLNYWAADPFPIEIEGILYIFGEIYEYSKLKGSIGYTKLEDGNFTPWKIVIEENYHLSFPNLMYINGVLYMCPEACASEQLYYYRCVSFPNQWVKDKILIDNVNFSDTIFYEKNNDKYGFTCVWETNDNHSFKMFKIENDNIVLSERKLDTLDFYLTRPAGKIFKENNSERDLMVSQICKPVYGSGLIIKDFEVNWPFYKEHELYRIYPNDIKCNKKYRYVGMHTLNYTENYVVIDLIWNRLNLIEKFFRGFHRIKRTFNEREILNRYGLSNNRRR